MSEDRIAPTLTPCSWVWGKTVAGLAMFLPGLTLSAYVELNWPDVFHR